MSNTRIRELRKSQNMTQIELAGKLSVKPAAVYKWESDRNYPSVTMAIKLADVFGCSLDYLFCRDTSSGA